MSFATAQKIADAVLYEGYVLYPYRASAAKNQVRWQFGIVAPRAYKQAGGSEPWFMQTECLVDGADAAVLNVRLRFLHVQARAVEKAVDPRGDSFCPVETLEISGRAFVTWDEGVERERDLREFTLAEILAAERVVPLGIQAGQDIELIHEATGQIAGRIVRERRPIAGDIRVAAKRIGSAVKLTLRIENTTPWPSQCGVERNQALRHSLVSAHTLLAVRGGKFISLLDPPEWARALAASCINENTWPVLVGESERSDTILSSPIILYDYPAVAPESPGDLCDATEIDEILTLRTMTLTEAEKREARATDARAAAIIDHADNIPPQVFERLHGAVRYLRTATTKSEDEPATTPWWDPGADASVSPETDSINIGGVTVTKGSRVRLRPGRRADAQDMFLVGRIATVQGVFFDVENNSYLAVSLTDDPAAELHEWHGRYLYFYPDEIEPLDGEAETDEPAHE
jgi:hypothetical protein